MLRPTLADLKGETNIDTRDLTEVLDADASSFGEGDFELACAIVALREEGISEFEDGAQLIREDTFEDYARELADDIGAIDRNAQWPLTHINWTSAARDLQQDYSTVEFLGYTYLVRS